MSATCKMGGFCNGIDLLSYISIKVLTWCCWMSLGWIFAR